MQVPAGPQRYRTAAPPGRRPGSRPGRCRPAPCTRRRWPSASRRRRRRWPAQMPPQPWTPAGTAQNKDGRVGVCGCPGSEQAQRQEAEWEDGRRGGYYGSAAHGACTRAWIIGRRRGAEKRRKLREANLYAAVRSPLPYRTIRARAFARVHAHAPPPLKKKTRPAMCAPGTPPRLPPRTAAAARPA
jgi:hypothetical protein